MNSYGNGNKVGTEETNGVELASVVEEYREKAPRVKVAKPGTMNRNSELFPATYCPTLEDALDAIPSIKGPLLVSEQENKSVLANSSALAHEKQHRAIDSVTKVMNTYCRRYSKSPTEGDLRTANALVVWVGGAEKGDTDCDVVRVEQEGGRCHDPMYAEEMVEVSALDNRHRPSNWVLQKILDFSKMVSVSCDGYENRLLQPFEGLEANRGDELGTSRGKTGRKGDRELKRLECSVNYEYQGWRIKERSHGEG